MDFFTRITPVYKNADNRMQMRSQLAAPSGLMGFLGSLLGRSTPIYKTADGHIAQAPASSGFLSMFAVTPSYKTAPSVAQADTELAETDVVAALVEAEPVDLPVDDAMGSCGPTQIVLF
jgi:hypothetical protein